MSEPAPFLHNSWSMQPAVLGIDSGATRARRMLQKLIFAEGYRP